jgi:large subunit ribosomal protein L4
MVNCVVKNWQGEQTGEATIELRVAKPENATHIVHRALVRQTTNARQGTASSKTRSEVRGGGRKPWRQKGTGRARAGSIRSPLWRGGGVIFGPKPREFNLKMNRKERRLALRTAFVSRAQDLIVVENFAQQFEQLERPKTRELVSALNRWGVTSDSKVLLILSEIPEKIELSARNISSVKLIKAISVNIYDIITADKIVVTADALAKIQEVYGE